ncbi:endodeoxyribonuclease RusA [Pseudomonas juntendi]|uniref:endodeoxyribonuclease RusA n=1 Tax=Pseudomonas TaxID=286 RepID=UPI0018E6AEDD|nr:MULTISPECIES: endodeoxyribonuclease RusA [Pseudomonas]MBI6913241.1 endodeoxyribonuclease RusA [Pseudomonas juntendi]MDG9807757.1 endodeoxyribonuclease RusA [Pseudomonas juntendi]
MNELTLPWPPAACSPNARVHWSKKSRAAKAYRAACHVLAKQAGLPSPVGQALLVVEFVPPDRRRRDDDNLLAMFKAGRDGLADALGIDDNVFATQIRVSKETTKGGAVRVRIQAQETAA